MHWISRSPFSSADRQRPNPESIVPSLVIRIGVVAQCLVRSTSFNSSATSMPSNSSKAGWTRKSSGARLTERPCMRLSTRRGRESLYGWCGEPVSPFSSFSPTWQHSEGLASYRMLAMCGCISSGATDAGQQRSAPLFALHSLLATASGVLGAIAVSLLGLGTRNDPRLGEILLRAGAGTQHAEREARVENPKSCSVCAD